MTRTDPAAINFIQFMRRRAIARCQERGGIEPGLCLEVTDSGNLTCIATGDGETTDGVPLYRTCFEINGQSISLIDAERAVMGEEVTA